jgi:uncharacterized membrane protein YedE/YeeE
MLVHIISLFSGLLFAVGLVVSGMVNPDKVKGFLDITGTWDYSLMFVMGGAVGVNLITFNILKKKKPICAVDHFLPKNKQIDNKIVIGAIMFGIGWGLIGICPGPGIVNLVKFDLNIVIFVASMLIGMFLYSLFEKLIID